MAAYAALPSKSAHRHALRAFLPTYSLKRQLTRATLDHCELCLLGGPAHRSDAEYRALQEALEGFDRTCDEQILQMVCLLSPFLKLLLVQKS